MLRLLLISCATAAFCRTVVMSPLSAWPQEVKGASKMANEKRQMIVGSVELVGIPPVSIRWGLDEDSVVVQVGDHRGLFDADELRCFLNHVTESIPRDPDVIDVDDGKLKAAEIHWASELAGRDGVSLRVEGYPGRASIALEATGQLGQKASTKREVYISLLNVLFYSACNSLEALDSGLPRRRRRY
jgi:hypothetical protein